MPKNSSPRGERIDARAPSTSLRRKPGVKPREIADLPEPLYELEDEPAELPHALRAQADRFGESCWHLYRAITSNGHKLDRTTLQNWFNGTKSPRSVASFAVLERIEKRYRLPAGYFRSKLPHPGRAATGHNIDGIGPAERRRMAWHLPDDFDQRPASERAAIITWVRDVVISGSTEYRRYQREALKDRYGLRFSLLGPLFGLDNGKRISPDKLASPALSAEIADLVKFKTATLSSIGYQRSGIWNDYTAGQRVEHLSLFFGALAGPRESSVRGLGVPREELCLAHLAFPAVWDWYVRWREKRRGFFTGWECNMLHIGVSFVRRETGWLRQNPQLADRLFPIAGLVSEEDINLARADWPEQCERMYRHGLVRAKEVDRVVRIHRDPFEPILPVLEAAKPVAEYLRIADEVLRYLPDAKRHPVPAAESVRSFLMIRLGLHLGIRQRNLRELRLCKRGTVPMSERQLEAHRQGEIRWSERDAGWEVLIPATAFKNAGSSFFANKPFRLLLPDLGRLYEFIDRYIEKARPLLIGPAADPGTFFVKSAKRSSTDAAYDGTSFYEAWRLITQRYGVYNPYTGRGAIAGLLPHGPHNVRDVLATHILKQTGSYEQASYAIQDTPATVAQHYGRFLPQDKSAMAAAILNQVWEAA
ncbi:hypothetical protein [Rhizorhabdus wittichii]|uniref:hypothetical protein n=1 Tax=Rhizorhabdus wittichii TaxID=160791 RepID=UPI0002ECA8E6|nr:hypothetical protein [Rhizorhabdus wittichii]